MPAVLSARKNSKLNVLTLDDVFDPKFAAKSYGGKWIGKLQNIMIAYQDGCHDYRESAHFHVNKYRCNPL